jgi:hypothetical protein
MHLWPRYASEQEYQAELKLLAEEVWLSQGLVRDARDYFKNSDDDRAVDAWRNARCINLDGSDTVEILESEIDYGYSHQNRRGEVDE